MDAKRDIINQEQWRNTRAKDAPTMKLIIQCKTRNSAVNVNDSNAFY